MTVHSSGSTTGIDEEKWFGDGGYTGEGVQSYMALY